MTHRETAPFRDEVSDARRFEPLSADTPYRMAPRIRSRLPLWLAGFACLASSAAGWVQDPETPPVPDDPVEEEAPQEGAPPVDSPEETGETEESTEPAEAPVDPWTTFAPYADAYRSHRELAELVTGWIESSETRLRRVQLPATRGGLEVPAFEWGTAGSLPLEERPTLILLGGLDGVSFAGGEAVLKAASSLIRRRNLLPEELTFIAIPWASPDGLERTFHGLSTSGVNLGKTDEDGDESPDEDGPDDLDGDGVLLDMLIEDGAGEWTRASDPRFLAKARPGDAPRYRLVREGADQDGDGRFNEDEVGGVELDRNFPVGWRSEGRGGRTGTWPLSEDLARAIADLVLERPTACVLLLQGNHGSLAYPGGIETPYWSEDADRPCWEWAATRLTEAMGGASFVPRTLREARDGERAGAALDWLYVACGIPAMEVALWGPNIASGPADSNSKSTSEPLDAQFRPEPQESEVSMGPGVSNVDRAWARWLDNQRGGVGFTEWHPVELGGGESVLLGGWAPRTRLNPPDDELPRVLDGIDRFVEDLVRGFPKLSISLDEARREGSILHMSARVANLGQIATGMATEPRAPDSPAGVNLELVLPAGARILAGTGQVQLDTLAGGAKSPVVEWIVLAPQGSVIKLRASSAWTLDTELEVRP